MTVRRVGREEFLHALQFVQFAEGGYSNHPADKGGITFAGITQRTYDAFRDRKKLPRRPVRQSTPSEREAIFYGYWCDCGAYELGGRAAVVHFDMAVNSGPGQAVRTLQRVLKVPPTGQWNPETRAAVLESDSDHLALDLIDARRRFYQSLVDKDASQAVFSVGWQRRLNHLFDYLWLSS